MDDRWGETESWVGDGLRREVFFFASGGQQLYGSLYAAVPPSRPMGVVICNSWGFEGNQSDRTMQQIALDAARAGGAGMVFHYPGFGDSHGKLADSTLETLADAAADALAEAARRRPGAGWALAGLMFGASVAALAAQRADADRLLLVQPVLQPSSYLARLERSARRAAVRVPARAGNAYGYPLPRRILAAGTAADSAVAAALEGFEGEAAVVRYAAPPRAESIPARFEDIVLPGTWRFGAKQKPGLAAAASDWLQRAGVEAGA